MDLEADLERVLWHELGHLFIDIIQCEELKNYSVDFMFVGYIDNAKGDNKWNGGVRIEPSTKFEEIVKDFNLTSYAILSLMSGCIFETVFRVNNGNKEALFEKCFCMGPQCAGLMDSKQFYQLNIEFRKFYGYRVRYVEFIEKELNVIYFKKLQENNSFLSDVDSLSKKLKATVLKSFYSSNSNFVYQFVGEELESIKKEIIVLLDKSNYRSIFKEILAIIVSEISQSENS